MTLFIGVLGRSRSGKDTAAAILSEVLGFPIHRLAAPVKDACHALFDIPRDVMEHGGKEVVDARYGKTPRDLLMWLTSSMQRDFPPDFFFSRLVARLPVIARGVIVPDVRYRHDVDNIRQRGGIVIKISRDHPPVRHAHEHAIDALHGDMLLENNETLEAFEKRVLACAQTLACTHVLTEARE
jgi:hypothetical protein